MRKYVLVLTSLIVLTIFSGICSAEVPHLINFQGYLVDSANNPLNGDYEITFKIYNDSKGGDLVWSETNIIPVEQGLYSIVLGKQNPIKQKIEGDIWFAMQINGQPEMEPRYRSTSVLYSIMAENAKKLDGYEVSSTPEPGKIVPLGADGKLPSSVLPGTGLNSQKSLANSSKGDTPAKSIASSSGNPTPSTSGGNIGRGESFDDIIWNQQGGTPGKDDILDACGWTDDGSVVRLHTTADSVGIGTDDPSVKFHVVGEAIIGPGNTNTGDYSFCVGYYNDVSGDYSSITGGGGNTASGFGTAVIGGGGNTASGDTSAIGGGYENTSSGDYAVISGGWTNEASGRASTIGGGIDNSVAAVYGGVAAGSENDAGDATTDTAAFVGGGLKNAALGKWSAVLGGINDTASGNYSIVNGGLDNTASGQKSVVSGGQENLASASSSTIGGGYDNVASASSSTIGGGSSNDASGSWSTIGGGGSNTASSTYSTIGGGGSNTASGGYSTLSGGYDNYSSGYYSSVGGGAIDTTKAIYGGVSAGFINLAGDAADDTAAYVGGGRENSATGMFSAVLGGRSNTASGNRSTIAGGHANTASAGGGGGSTVSGGSYNLASGQNGTVGGGIYDTATGPGSVISGGGFNTTSGTYATIPGGDYNSAGGDNSFAAGHRAKADSIGCFVWADTTSADFSTTAPNQFLIRASGGVGILTDTAYTDLHVSGDFLAGGNGIDGEITLMDSDDTTLFNVTADGNGHGRLTLYDADGDAIVELGEGLDYAESFPTTHDDIEAGTVMIIDPQNTGKLCMSNSGYDKRVAGIVAGANGINSGVRLGYTGSDGEYPIALAGRVYCKVDGKYGSIKPGDLLTTSPTPGHAMVVKDYFKAQGAIIGKAMEAMSSDGTGEVLVLITLQ